MGTNMKRSNHIYIIRYLAALLAGVALAGCGKTVLEDNGEDVWNPLLGELPVRIRTSVNAPETKATGTSFDNNDQIGIFGFYHNGSGSTDASWEAETTAGTNIPDYMYNQMMRYNVPSGSTTGAWDYSPIKYWPNETGSGANSAHIDKLSFWGYYPYGGSGISFRNHGLTTAYANTSTGLPDIFFEVTDGSVDLMTSDLRSNLYKGMAKESGSDQYGKLTNGEVDLTFHHALSKVAFEVKKAVFTENPKPEPDLENYTVTITSIYLTNLHGSATYTPPASGWSGWSDSRPTMTVFSGSQVVTTSASSIGTVLPIPQTLADSGHEVALHIEYTLYTSSTGDLGGQTVNQTQEFLISDAGTTEWEEGKQYTYTLTFHNRGLYLKITSIDPWDDGGSFVWSGNIETNLFLDFPGDTYRLYDLDGVPTDWVNAFAAVAYGFDASGTPLYSPRMHLITTSQSEDLELVFIPENSNFRFVKFSNGSYTTNASLDIPAGDNVNTYFYVVPVSASIPASDNDRKASMYLRSKSGLPYLPINVSVLPGNADNTSCDFYIVSPEVYTSGTENIADQNK